MPNAPAIGWAIYGLGARAMSGVVFMIGPLLLIDAARSANEAEGDVEVSGGASLPHLIPTTVPQITSAPAGLDPPTSGSSHPCCLPCLLTERSLHRAPQYALACSPSASPRLCSPQSPTDTERDVC